VLLQMKENCLSLSKPPNSCTDDAWSLLIEPCFAPQPEKRPNFNAINAMFSEKLGPNKFCSARVHMLTIQSAPSLDPRSAPVGEGKLLRSKSNTTFGFKDNSDEPNITLKKPLSTESEQPIVIANEYTKFNDSNEYAKFNDSTPHDHAASLESTKEGYDMSPSEGYLLPVAPSQQPANEYEYVDKNLKDENVMKRDKSKAKYEYLKI